VGLTNLADLSDVDDFVSQQVLRIVVGPEPPYREFFTFARHTLRQSDLDAATIVARLRPALDLAEAKVRMETR
jgi:hypothetical protein